MLALTFFRHYLFSRRAGSLVRTVALVCIFGVGIGVSALVVVLSVMNGFNQSLRDRLLAVEPHLVVSLPNVSKFDQVLSHPLFLKLKQRTQLDVRAFENQEVMIRTEDGIFDGGLARGVDSLHLRRILRDIEKTTPQNHGPEQVGTDSETLEPMQTPVQADGPNHPHEIDLGAGEVILGVGLAERLGVYSGSAVTVISPEALLLPAGEKPDFEKATVTGLLTSNIADVDGKVLFYNREKTFLRLKDSASKEVGIEIRLPNAERFAPLKAELEAEGAKVASWVDRNSSLFFALRMEKTAMGVVLALSALISSFSIVTVLFLLLAQKRRDIGVLMSMGLSPRRARFLFMGVGLTLSMMGIGGGLILGLLVCWVVGTFPLDILPAIYYERTIPINVQPSLIGLILVVAVILSLLSAYWPAKQHTRQLPSDLLRARENIPQA